MIQVYLKGSFDDPAGIRAYDAMTHQELDFGGICMTAGKMDATLSNGIKFHLWHDKQWREDFQLVPDPGGVHTRKPNVQDRGKVMTQTVKPCGPCWSFRVTGMGRECGKCPR